MASRSERKQKEIQELMSHVPDLPKGFEKWIRESAFKNSRYIFYKRRGKKVDGLCSHCGQYVDVRKAAHNEPGRCPQCRSKITFKAINKAKYYDDTVVVSIIQKMNDRQFVIRYFRGRLEFKKGENTSDFPVVYTDKLTNPIMTFYEGTREVWTLPTGKIHPISINFYEELWHYKSSKYEWCTERTRTSFFNKELLRVEKTKPYRRNLRMLKNVEEWKYSGIEHCNMEYLNISQYLYAYGVLPQIEMLSKLKMNKLLYEVIYEVYWYGGVHGDIDLKQKMLGLDKPTFKTALRLNLGRKGIEFVDTLQAIKRYLPDDQITWAIENTQTDAFIQLMRYASPQKIINYTNKYGGNDKRHFVSTWRDYIFQCRTLNRDLKDDIVLFPKDLKAKHEEAITLIKLKTEVNIDKGIKEQYEIWKDKLFLEEGQLKVEVAASHKLILQEGKALNHCVGGQRYCKNMAEGKNLIIFVRKDNEPYSTIEWNSRSYEIIQHRAHRNKAPEKDVLKFVEQWEKTIMDRLSSKGSRSIA